MITAHKKNQAKRISGPIKLDIALQAIRRQQTVSEISKHFNCSRTTVYKQQDKALDAANKVFEQDAVLHILETTHRCSSMIENFNSRLRPYLDERKFMSKKSLGLIQFYLNHKPFMRSKHERLKGKTPAEALTGKAHKPWLEMLGFRPWYKQAA